MSLLAQKLCNAIRSVIGGVPSDFVPLHEPTFGGREKEYVLECIETGWVSSVGSFVNRFEKDLAAYCGVKRVVATVNGTAALHVALLMVGVERDEEVLIPTLSFIATANAVSYIGAVPHFVDSEEITLGLDPAKLDAYLEEIADRRDDDCYNRKTGRRIRAVVPMHAFGHPMRIADLVVVAEKWGLELIEDAAESLGSFVGKQHTGTFGKVSAVSFNGNKIATAGGGGAILTNDCDLADRVKHLTTTAKVPHSWRFFHDATGFNYRMPNLNAALIVAQIEQMSEFLKRKRCLAERYSEALAGLPGVDLVREPNGTLSNYWLCTLAIDDYLENELEKILEATNGQGIMTRPAWEPLHTLPMYSDCPRSDLAVAEKLSQQLINVPSGVRVIKELD